MTKSKYTIEIAKNIIEQDGNKLISTEYKNDKIPLEVQCGKCDNKYSVAFQSYKRGTRCKKCSDIERGKRKRTSIDKVKKLMDEKGDTLINTYYVRNRLRVTFKCSKCNEIYSLVYFDYQRRINCQCEKKKGKINHDYVYNYVKEQGDTLISQSYINAKEKLEIKCHKCDQIYKMNWTTYRRGSRCGLCHISKKKTYDEVKKLISDNGDELISKDYKNCISKLDIKCGRCDTVFLMTYSCYRQGYRCSKCSLKRISDKLRHSQEYVESYIAKHNDKLLSKYVKMDEKIKIKCGKCKKYI